MLHHLRYLSSGRILFYAALFGGGLFVAGVLALGGFNTVVEYTNRLEFCVSCHEMRMGPYAEYTQTTHYRNASGVRATCADCHVPGEWLARSIHKAGSLRELYHHVIGTLDTPEKYEANRLAMARRVWAEMEASDSQECRTCHSYPAMDFHKQQPAAAAAMERSAREGQTCIDCHKGIAHAMPDMTQAAAQALKAAQEAAKREGARAPALFAITSRPLFLERPAGAAEGSGEAQLAPASAVRVVGREGDWLQLVIEGWQPAGTSDTLYAGRDQPILVASLGQAAAARLAVLETATDPAGGQVWHRVALTAWTAVEDLLADPAPLWAYGQDLNAAACGTCHFTYRPGFHTARAWADTMETMRGLTTLDEEQARFLLKYLQLHAREIGRPQS